MNLHIVRGVFLSITRDIKILKNFRIRELYANELFRPFIIFILIFIILKISSKLTLFSIPIIFLFLLIFFIKDTKLLFYMFIISLPFTGVGWTFRIGETGFFFYSSYFFFILVLLSFLSNKFKKRDYSFFITPIDFQLFLFLAIATLSVFQTIYISNAPLILYDSFRNYPWIRGFMNILFLLFMFAIFYISVNIINEHDLFKKSLIVFLATSLLVSLYGLFGYAFTLITSVHIPGTFDPLVLFNLRIKSVFREPLFFGSYVLSIVPILYCLLISKLRYLHKPLLVFASITLTLSLFLTESRGVWFAYLIFLALLTIIYWNYFFKCQHHRHIIREEMDYPPY